MKSKKVEIEVQHFEGCPNSVEMINRVKVSISELSDYIVYKEILVETKEVADRVKFRGSPTVLINGIDIENMPEPINANLSCRYYKNGIPSVEQIRELIAIKLQDEDEQ